MNDTDLVKLLYNEYNKELEERINFIRHVQIDGIAFFEKKRVCVPTVPYPFHKHFSYSIKDLIKLQMFFNVKQTRLPMMILQTFVMHFKRI